MFDMQHKHIVDCHVIVKIFQNLLKIQSDEEKTEAGIQYTGIV